MDVDVGRAAEHCRCRQCSSIVRRLRYRLETCLPNDRRYGGRREELDQPFRGVGILRALGNCRRENRHLLRAFGQRSDDGDARHGLELADLLEPDLHVAARNRIADTLVRFDHLALRLDLLGDAKAREQNVAQVDAAGAVR